MKNLIKHKIPFSIGIICILTIVFAFRNYPPKDRYLAEKADAVTNATDENWFTAKEVAHNVWCIDDHGGDNIYLVVGKDSALIIDTGTGVADLASFVKTITSLPLIVVNTHGHPDHVGGNFQFEEVYIHSLDFDLEKVFDNKKYHDGAVKQAVKNHPDFKSSFLKKYPEKKTCLLLPVKEGDVFDLGDRKLEVIGVPGHTKGGICLLDEANKLIFTGDNNNTLVWLFLDGCLPLESYIRTLEKLKGFGDKFDTMLPGHGEPLDKSFLDELIGCGKIILSGECKGEEYKTFAGNGMICKYKGAQIAFNPDNLFEK